MLRFMIRVILQEIGAGEEKEQKWFWNLKK